MSRMIKTGSRIAFGYPSSVVQPVNSSMRFIALGHDILIIPFHSKRVLEKTQQKPDKVYYPLRVCPILLK